MLVVALYKSNITLKGVSYTKYQHGCDYLSLHVNRSIPMTTKDSSLMFDTVWLKAQERAKVVS